MRDLNPACRELTPFLCGSEQAESRAESVRYLQLMAPFKKIRWVSYDGRRRYMVLAKKVLENQRGPIIIYFLPDLPSVCYKSVEMNFAHAGYVIEC